MMKTLDIVKKATLFLEQNKECYVAAWLTQNKGKNIDDYELVYSLGFDGITRLSLSPKKRM